MTSHTLFARKTKTVQLEDSFLTNTDENLLSLLCQILLYYDQLMTLNLVDANV